MGLATVLIDKIIFTKAKNECFIEKNIFLNALCHTLN